jgi:glycosyltransferase involved in cell wall biosynthesis
MLSGWGLSLARALSSMPVGYGQSRRAWVLVAAMCFSRTMVGATGEGCLHAGSGRPTDELAGFCGRLPGTRARAQQTTPSPLRSSGVPAGGTLVTVLNFDGPQPGNFVPAQIRASEAARATLGLDSHVVAPEQARGTPWVADVEAAGFGVSFVDRDAPFPRLAGQLASTLRERSARLVHSHFTRFDLHCALAGPSAGTKVLWHVHSGLRGYPRAQRVKDLVKVRLLGRLCDSVVANSEQTYRDCLMRGFPPRKIDLVLNGLVLERLAPARERRVAARAELGVSDDAFVFLAFGWDPERKGVDLILRATEALAARAIVPGVLVTLTGREPLDAAVDRQLSGERPPWLRLQKPLDDVATLYAAADAFVSASREDAFSFAIGEAMACGLPVISSHIPGPSHYFESPGVTTFPSEDWRALAFAMERLALRADHRAVGEENRAFAQRFDVRHYAERTVQVYERLLTGRPAPGAR